MKKNTKKLLAIAFMAIFVISTVSVVGLSAVRKTSDNTGTTLTGTPADNYPDDKRPTFCETGGAKSTAYITEFKIPTACVQPLGIIIGPSGNAWFTETNAGNLGKFDPTTKSFEEFPNEQWQKGEKSMMWGIRYAQDGNIWFSDSQHNLIWKFGPKDKSYTKFIFPPTKGQDSFPQMMVTDGSNILVNDFTGKKIAIFNTDQNEQGLKARIISSPGDFNFTSTMIPDGKGNIWYTIWIYHEKGELVSYNQETGNQTEYELPSEIQAPNGIAVDSNGKIWVTDTGSSYFFSFDPTSQKFVKFITPTPPVSTYGNSSGLIKTPITRPYWTYFDDKGRLWFNEQVANSLAVFDPVKKTLVEYQVPSKNPNWSDCGTQSDCGVAQVLDFTVSHDKVWFTEWVENNIGVLDSSVPLPFDLSGPDSMTIQRGHNATISLTITSKEPMTSPVTILDAHTAGLHNISLSLPKDQITIDKPTTVKANISVDDFALSGTYNVLVGIRYNDITISKFISVTIE